MCRKKTLVKFTKSEIFACKFCLKEVSFTYLRHKLPHLKTTIESHIIFCYEKDMIKRLTAKPLLETLRENQKKRVDQFFKKMGQKPKLAVVLVGDDPASMIYTQSKGKKAEAIGMEHLSIRFPKDVSPTEVHQRIQELNQDPSVHGILIQRPLPKQFDEDEVLYWVSQKKDVDVFHPENAGKVFLGMGGLKPCTPYGIMKLLDFYQIDVSGKVACVIGRSSIVGKPIASLLLQANATVIQCHSKTKDLKKWTSQSDLLIVAAGRQGILKRDFFKEGAIVVDVGIHRDKDNKICGDVNPNELGEVSAVTPVPGGVGPMTIAMLLENTLTAAELDLPDK